MLRIKMGSVLFLLLLLSLTACTSRPDYVLDENEMTAVLIDMHSSEALIDLQRNQFSTQEAQRDIMASVFVRHGITRARYDSSLMWYSRHLKRFIRIYDRVNDSLKVRDEYWKAIAYENASWGVSDQGDSVNLWRINPYLVLDGKFLSSFQSFVVPCDSNFRKGDSLVWNLRISQLPAQHYLVATIAATYPKDSAAAQTALALRDTTIQLSAVTDTLHDFESIILSISLMGTDITAEPVTFVDSVSLMRFHK